MIDTFYYYHFEGNYREVKQAKHVLMPILLQRSLFFIFKELMKAHLNRKYMGVLL